MITPPSARTRALTAATVLFGLLAIIGGGVLADVSRKLLFWHRADATHLGDRSGAVMRGNQHVASYVERRYLFKKADGAQVLLTFGEREPSEAEKPMRILYDPS